MKNLKEDKEFIKSVLNKINNNQSEKPISFYVRLIGKEISKTFKIIHYLEEKGYLEIYQFRGGKKKHNRFKDTFKGIKLTTKGKSYLKRINI